MPLKFHLPGNIAQETVTAQAVPGCYRKLRIPIEDAQATCVSGHWGVMIRQQVPVKDSVYNELYAEPLIDMELSVSVTEPLIIVQVMLTGNLRLSYPNGHISLQTGKIGLLYLAPGVPYKISFTGGNKYRAVYFRVPLSLLEGLSEAYPLLNDMLASYGQDVPLKLPNIRVSAAHRTEIEKMKNCYLAGPARNLYINNRISDLLIAYLNDLSHISEQDSRLILQHEKEIDEFIERVEQCPEEHVNVEQRAQLLGLPERILECAFKVKIGSTVKIYVSQQRVEKAKQLLVDTMQSVADIAMEVGYSDPSYFIKVFKQAEGITPGRYRSDHNAEI
ncbi:helix-turn-helix transcriptional regulator [Chitinophaga tropicalis]|uniref:Helix-turn-helix domain-containing protein n=1 Tax=Chitinophaga tropicalis TaxID=2683588 RepID=A0A7K1UDY8_9BACT|nr:AraC family transcriptional regulator [Chitinophaga tropicalis]MVT12490.1 helix-turn-helix domain-containing protein [Chitinophaga tropicalis]